MPNPLGLSYVKVVGRYQIFTADSLDSDDLPDFIDLEGTGIITPNLLEAKNLNPGLTSVYLPDPIPVKVVAGLVSDKNGANPYVMLLAPSAGVSPVFFNYSIKLALRPVGSAADVPYTTYGPFNFDPVPAADTGVVDLALATPVAVAEGDPMTAGAPGPAGDMVLVAAPSNSGATIALAEAHLPSARHYTLTANVSLTLPTPGNTRSGTITLYLKQDATGGRTIAWPATVKWPDGITQQPAAAANSVSDIHLQWTGYEWHGILAGKSFA